MSGGAVSPLRVGIVGVGTISGAYLDRLPRYPGVRVTAVADLDAERARAVGVAHGIRSLPVEALLTDDAVDLVLNLTVPAAHAAIARRALDAGKHVYGEKPLALVARDGRELLGLADERGLLVGSAPDTVLGTGVQTARAVVDAGGIGEPVGASVQWGAPGHELWHPAPAFYYQPGAGPLFDMGPYYLSALVTLLGPVATVTGAATRSARRRTTAVGPDAGADISVEVDTHVTALLTHVSGAVSTVTVSFEIWGSRVPLFEVYGTAGALAVPDPNGFDGTVELWDESAAGGWRATSPLAGYVDAGRGVGVADLAGALASGGGGAGGRDPRASGALALHVLEVMEGVLASAHERRVVEIETQPERPAAVALGADPAS